jgi:hypothetical protein
MTVRSSFSFERVRFALGTLLASLALSSAAACSSGLDSGGPEAGELEGVESSESTESALVGAACKSSLDCGKGEFCDLGCMNMFKPGECTAIPDRCLDVWDPVCGCDNRTYSNDCYRRKAKVGLKSSDACVRITPG